MVNIGFICEGYTEKTIIDSKLFQYFLKNINLNFVGSINTKSNSQLLPHLISKHNKTLEKMGAWKILIITDSDKDTIEKVYERIKPNPDLHILIIAVKKIESWFLSNNQTLEKITTKTYHDFVNEQINKKLPINVEELGTPYDKLKEIIRQNTNIRALDKLEIADLFIENGFDIENSNCESAKYFIKKLREISENKYNKI